MNQYSKVTHALALILGLVVLALTQPAFQAAIAPYPKVVAAVSVVVTIGTVFGVYRKPS
jgi:hypothetical protein